MAVPLLLNSVSVNRMMLANVKVDLVLTIMHLKPVKRTVNLDSVLWNLHASIDILSEFVIIGSSTDLVLKKTLADSDTHWNSRAGVIF